MANRIPPASVRRHLRQEAHFGCAACGCPILDYHHIIPWEEREHFDVEHMIALCPTHHRHFGKMQRETAYKAKRRPYNATHNHVRGDLATNKEKLAVLSGSNLFINCDAVLSFCDIEILACRISDGEAKISAYIPDKDFWPEIKIVDNDLVAGTAGFWDIEYKTNYVAFRRKKGSKYFEIDLRDEYVKVSAELDIHGVTCKLSPSGFFVGGRSPKISIKNSRFSDLPSAYLIQPPPGYAFERPNHVKLVPRGRLVYTGRRESFAFAGISIPIV